MTTPRGFSLFTNSRATARLVLLGGVVLVLTALAPLAPGSTVAAARAGGTVTVHKRACPTGFDAYSATYDQLSRACPEPMNGVLFLLGSHMGSQTVWNKQNTGTTLAGGVVWIGVPAGLITVAEQLPTGYGRPIVYCAGGTQSDPGVPVQMTLASNFHLTHPLLSGQSPTCDWFNVPSSSSLSSNKG
jgi:hypothetical protein